MKTKILYQWEDTDPSRNFIIKAILPLTQWLDYKPINQMSATGQDEALVKSLCAVTNAGGFDEQDVRNTAEFLQMLAKRSAEYSNQRTIVELPWLKEIGKAQAQAEDAAKELLKLFYDKAPNLKSIGSEPKQGIS